MGLFSSHDDIEHGVLIDIGSGSVLAAIVSSDPKKTYPDIIWSKREFTPLKSDNSGASNIKNILTSLMNALMALNGEGRKVFFEQTSEQKLPNLQVTIAAPWSYTTTKTISFKNQSTDPIFTVSDEIVNELLQTASKKVAEEVQANEQMHNLDLAIIARTTLQVIANGYVVEVTDKQKASSLQIIQASAVAQQYLIDAIIDAQDKMLPDTNLMQYSFMLPYYFTMSALKKNITEYCLVDITYEATEIGVVRNGVLSYCTHTPYGVYSIARKLAEVLGVPVEEAYGYLTDTSLANYLDQFSDKQKIAVQEIFNEYQERLQELFVETGDSLSIPKIIYLHGNLYTEPFFNAQILDAATAVTKMKHAAYNVTTELLVKNFPPEMIERFRTSVQDTALLISAQFFHTREHHAKFEQL